MTLAHLAQSDFQAAQLAARQQQARPQQMQVPQQSNAHQVLPGLPPHSNPQQHPSSALAARQHIQPHSTHPQGGAVRPIGTSLAGGTGPHVRPQGHIKAEAEALQPGPLQMQRAPSPQMRSVSPAPGGLAPVQLAQQHAAMQQAQGVLTNACALLVSCSIRTVHLL